MPRYDYTCEQGHTTEQWGNYDLETIICPVCGEVALRQAIYLDQAIFTETGSKPSRRVEVPRDERRYDKKFKLYREASQELDYKHKKAEELVQHELPSRNLYQKGLKKAKALKAMAANG